MTTMTDLRTPTLVFDEPTEYLRRDYETASAWSRYLVQPGRYEIAWVTIGYHPYTPGIPAGYVADPGPYYGLVRLDVRQVESYYENRLWNQHGYASSVQNDHTPNAPVIQLARSTYAYLFLDSHYPERDGRPARDVPRITTWLDGRVEYPA